MADDNGSTIPAPPQYWLIPFEFAWREFTVAHRERLCVYASLAPVIGRIEWRGLLAEDQRKLHTAFLQQYGVEVQRTPYSWPKPAANG